LLNYCLLLTILFLFSEYSDKFVLSEYFLFLAIFAQNMPFCAVFLRSISPETDFCLYKRCFSMQKTVCFQSWNEGSFVLE